MLALLLCVVLGVYIYHLQHTAKSNHTIDIECVASSVQIPSAATDGSACVDLCAHLPKKPMRLKAGEIKKIPTGLKLQIPSSMEVVVRSRSGLALRGVVVANSPGTIDSDYRKEIFVILRNVSKMVFVVTNGMRIAQAGARRLPARHWRAVECIEKSERGGFGSTGLTIAKPTN